MSELTPGQLLARQRWDKQTDREDMKAHAKWMTAVRIAKAKGEPVPTHPARKAAKGKKKAVQAGDAKRI